MFTALWAVAVILNGVPVGHVLMGESPPYADQANCERAIKDHESRMLDFIRGKINADWSVEIKVQGICQPAGDPS
jgi:hypothetical protein